jgi:hypothetical protein
MTDPNLEKIANTNIVDLEKGFLGKTITQASSYLHHMYGLYNRDKRIIELANFTEAIQLMSDKLKIKKNNEETDNGKKQQQKQRRV